PLSRSFRPWFSLRETVIYSSFGFGLAPARDPAFDVALARARDAERSARNVAGDRGARRHERVILDGHRRDQVHVAADEGAFTDRRAVFRLAVVVHDDRSAAEAGLRADVGVADVGEVIGLHAGPDHALLPLDEVADPGSAADRAVGPQVRVRAHLDVVADPARLDHAAELEMDAAADPRRALDHATRLDQRVGSDLDVHVDVGGRGVDDRDTGRHHAGQGALAHARFGQRQLRARVHAERFVGIGERDRLHTQAVAHRELDDRREVELSLGIAVVHALEKLPEQARVEQVDAGVALADRELV